MAESVYTALPPVSENSESSSLLSESEDDNSETNSEFGLMKKPFSASDMSSPYTASLFITGAEAHSAFYDAIDYLKNHPKVKQFKFSIVQISRIRLKMTAEEKEMKRKIYRRKYLNKPEVKARLNIAKMDSARVEKKREYNRRPEVRERKKKQMKLEKVLYRYLASNRPNMVSCLKENPELFKVD